MTVHSSFHPHLPHIATWSTAKQELAGQFLILLILLALLALG
jgi:hypothetical protein